MDDSLEERVQDLEQLRASSDLAAALASGAARRPSS